MNWFDKLIEEALADEYLNELIVKAEKAYTLNFLNLKPDSAIDLSEKEFTDLLRFSDILCRSKSPFGRNKSYKIISLLYDRHYNDP